MARIKKDMTLVLLRCSQQLEKRFQCQHLSNKERARRCGPCIRGSRLYLWKGVLVRENTACRYRSNSNTDIQYVTE